MWRQPLDDIGKQLPYTMVFSEWLVLNVLERFIQSCKTTIDQWSPSEVWLDLGGTAEVLERLPVNISYMGVDSNTSYIEFAKDKYQQDPIPFLSVQTGTTHSGTHY